MRRLWVLVSNLPSDGAVARTANPERFGWKTEHELLASLIEANDAALRQVVAVLVASHEWKTKPQLWKAITVPRPGQPIDAPVARKPMNSADIRAAFLKGADG